MRGGDLSCEAETSRGGSSSGKLVEDAANWTKTGRLGSEGLDQCLLSSLSSIFALTLSILAFTLSMLLECLVVLKGGNLAVKGGPNSGPRHRDLPLICYGIRKRYTDTPSGSSVPPNDSSIGDERLTLDVLLLLGTGLGYIVHEPAIGVQQEAGPL
jgi:hypothetical protein